MRCLTGLLLVFHNKRSTHEVAWLPERDSPDDSACSVPPRILLTELCSSGLRFYEILDVSMFFLCSRWSLVLHLHSLLYIVPDFRVGLQLPSCLLLSNLSSLTTVFIQYLLFLIFSVLDYHFGCAFLLNYFGHHRHHHQHHHQQHHHHQHHHHHNHHHQHHHHHHRHHHHHHDHYHIIIITTTIIIIIKTMKSSSSSKLFSTRMDKHVKDMLKIYKTPRITSKARINVTRLFGIIFCRRLALISSES